MFVQFHYSRSIVFPSFDQRTNMYDFKVFAVVRYTVDGGVLDYLVFVIMFPNQFDRQNKILV